MKPRRDQLRQKLRPSRERTFTYWRFLALNPAMLAASSTAILAVGTLAGPLAASGAFCAFLAASAALAVLTRIGLARRAIDRMLEAQRRLDRAFAREARLERINSHRALDVRQLNILVRQVERTQPFESRLLELEELLEHFVERAIVLEQCRSLVPRAGPLAPNDDAVRQSPMRTELVRRNIQLREACERRAIRLDAELEAIIEFVQLVALKAACPAEGSDDDDVLERRLREMDEWTNPRSGSSPDCE